MSAIDDIDRLASIGKRESIFLVHLRIVRQACVELVELFGEHVLHDAPRAISAFDLRSHRFVGIFA